MSEEGRCPKCRSEDIDYGDMTRDGERIYYPFTCANCGFRGKEWYYVEFDTMTDEEGEEV